MGLDNYQEKVRRDRGWGIFLLEVIDLCLIKNKIVFQQQNMVNR
jgi:hypothetical protein